MGKFVRLWITAVFFVAAPVQAAADELVAAVASNFLPAAEMLKRRFESSSVHRVRLSSGSTGKLYAQIMNAAPYDILLAADAERPRLLEQQGRAVEGSRFTYALGQLAIYSRDPLLAGAACARWHEFIGKRKLAIANPALAPYGVAARQYLSGSGQWQAVQANLVMGENVSQALQFAVDGGALLGFVAAAQLQAPTLPEASCAVLLPASAYDAIEQQAVLLQRASNNAAASAFLSFLRSEEARRLIVEAGYRVPVQ